RVAVPARPARHVDAEHVVGRAEVMIAQPLGGLREVAHGRGVAVNVSQRQRNAELHGGSPLFVIAGEAKQSRASRIALDCFVPPTGVFAMTFQAIFSRSPAIVSRLRSCSPVKRSTRCEQPARTYSLSQSATRAAGPA